MDRASMISVLEDTKQSSYKCLKFLTEEDASYYTFKERSEALDMAIAALREQEQSKWISVEERLPGVQEDVWCYSNKNGGDMFIGYIGYHTRDWVKNGILYVGDVTHWMPLPEPPKEGAEE